ncbi:uncharacterized protein UTRI_05412_B [Ustilago trichophora]|uniref:BHLH domain-containing protein n=1 Tax=Ustilago trichophora TaxID=86804 RepID=A0A5C3EMN9_9BASI|nr:uncharacterized protein UTRI_05412_B [Ustilago trichophora]
MFPTRAFEGDRNTLPPISSLSSSHELLHDSRPSSAHDHHQTPPAGLPPRPQREMEPLRPGPFPRSAEEAYAAPTNSKFTHNGPPPPFHRDMKRGSPVSDEGAWRSYDRTKPRFGTQEGYSPHVPSAPHAARDDGRTAPWQRPSDEPHRPRMPAPPAGMRDDGSWRPVSTSRDRADLHPEAFAHERARVEESWREERSGRIMHPYDAAPGYPSMGPYGQDVRAGVRPLDADYADDARRIRRRATSSLVEEEQNAQRYPLSVARPHGLATYSPPGSRSQSAAPNQASVRPGTMPGMEPPRPASTLGVMPNASPAASAAPAQAPAATNTVNANRRVAHLLSEQKRRESINTGFEDLRQAIPACRDGQDSKATILKRALEYIRELESVVERQHRPPLESHTLGGYSNRSPPDDKDDIRRFGRPGGDEDRRGSTRQMTGGSGSSSSDTGSGPRIGGLASNAFGGAPNGYPSAHAPLDVRAYPPYGSHNLPLAAHNLNMEAARSTVDQTRSGPFNSYHGPNGSLAKRWAEDSDEDQRSPSRRRVSDGDKDEVQRSPTGSNYLIAPGAHSRSPPLMHSPHLEKPRDWHSRLDNKSLVDSAVRV